MALRLYTYPNGANAMKALIAAEFSGAAIELPPFEMVRPISDGCSCAWRPYGCRHARVLTALMNAAARAAGQGVTNKTPDFLKLNPRGKVPTLELPCGRGVFESNAIARYVARVNGGGGAALFGANAREYAATEQWLDFAQNEVGSNVGAWLWPLYGFRAYDAQAEAKVRAMTRWAAKTAPVPAHSYSMWA